MSATMAREFPERRPVRMIFSDEDAFNAYAGEDAQGYLLARPMSPDALHELLRANSTRLVEVG